MGDTPFQQDGEVVYLQYYGRRHCGSCSTVALRLLGGDEVLKRETWLAVPASSDGVRETRLAVPASSVGTERVGWLLQRVGVERGRAAPDTKMLSLSGV